MDSLTPQITKILSTLTLLSDVTAVGLVAYFSFLYFNKKKAFLKNSLVKFFTTHAYLFSLLIALTATLVSLFYSEVAEYAPCKLCWYQRIFMYPLVPLLGLAVYKGDKKVNDYVILLAAIGASISFYHYLLQRSTSPFAPCSAVGYSVACSDYFTMSYGYITIPVMALTAFVIIILLMGFDKMEKKVGRRKK